MTDQQALEVIERICGDDFCEEMEMRGLPDSELKTAVDKLTMIYKISHSLVRSKVCHHVHDDWRQEAERMAKELPK